VSDVERRTPSSRSNSVPKVTIRRR
jgi:hypothetical protein